MPMGKLRAAKLQPELAETQAQQQLQPHPPISIAPWQVMWGDQPRGEAMQGLTMVDLRVAIMLLTKKWVDAHDLTVKEKVAKYISGTNGTVV